MGWISKIFSEAADGTVGTVLDEVGDLGKDIRQIATGELPADERAKLEKKAMRLEQLRIEGKQVIEQARAKIVATEAKSEHWLTANWRPLVMIFFAILIGCYWFGITADQIQEDTAKSLLQVLGFGIGGYVGGRSAEKIAKILKGAT
jgi:hypothetical protein